MSGPMMMQGPPGAGPIMVLSTLCEFYKISNLCSMLMICSHTYLTQRQTDQKTQRQTGREAQLSNIRSARAVSDIIRTTLGPRSMLKMLLDPMGSIILTNDGHCILREIDVSHPVAKSMIELSRATDEQVGDGTTSVIVLSAEVLSVAEPFLRQNVHPTVLVSAYQKALDAALMLLDKHSITVDVKKDEALMKKLVSSTLQTKFASRWMDQMVDMALEAVLNVAQEPSIDLKRYAKVEKIPGGELSDSSVLSGVMFNKEPVHASMKRSLLNPRILLLDCPLEYKKAESTTNMEVSQEQDWNALLKLEEDYVKQICQDIIACQPDIVITEKGVSDLAQHYLLKHDIVAFRRLRKTDNNRIAKATGATIVSRTDEIVSSDLGTLCHKYEMKMVGNEPFCCLTECDHPAACTIVLRGGSKDVLNEMERNLQDAMQVVRNVVQHPKLVPGGGAIEMAVGVGLRDMGQQLSGIAQGPFQAVGEAMECIPRTLAQNCGVGSVIRTITELRAKHNLGHHTWGIQGISGELVDMREYGIWEPLSVKIQTIKTSIESACMILRIDDIVSGSKTKK